MQVQDIAWDLKLMYAGTGELEPPDIYCSLAHGFYTLLVAMAAVGLCVCLPLLINYTTLLEFYCKSEGSIISQQYY